MSENLCLSVNDDHIEQRVEKKSRPTSLISRNLYVNGRRTSVKLEQEMWSALKDVARKEGGSIHTICTLIANTRSSNTSLTSAIRVFLVLYYRAAATEDGHMKAGHGSISRMQARARRLNSTQVTDL